MTRWRRTPAIRMGVTADRARVRSADETVEAARKASGITPIFGEFPEEPVIVEARFEATVVRVLPSTRQDLVRRRWEVYRTYRGMPVLRPWIHPPSSRLYSGTSRAPVGTRPRTPASELAATGPGLVTMSGHDPPSRGPSGRR